MGGKSIRHEPESTRVVQSNREVWQIFQNMGWDVYFDRLRGFDEELTVEFTQNLGEEGSRVCGVVIPIIEEIVAEVTRLPQVEEQLFVRRTPLPEFSEAFLQAKDSIA